MYYLNAAINYIPETSEGLWGSRKLTDFASETHKKHSEKHDHKDSDWLAANKRFTEVLIPLTQFFTIVAGENLVLDQSFHDPSDIFVIV